MFTKINLSFGLSAIGEMLLWIVGKQLQFWSNQWYQIPDIEIPISNSSVISTCKTVAYIRNSRHKDKSNTSFYQMWCPHVKHIILQNVQVVLLSKLSYAHYHIGISWLHHCGTKGFWHVYQQSLVCMEALSWHPVEVLSEFCPVLHYIVIVNHT